MDRIQACPYEQARVGQALQRWEGKLGFRVSHDSCNPTPHPSPWRLGHQLWSDSENSGTVPSDCKHGQVNSGLSSHCSTTPKSPDNGPPLDPTQCASQIAFGDQHSKAV
uniref:Uncharacterized protein n=1 Tax=Cryptomonas curvata TaxID=233186 RepID=A0A7S0QST3_9CRYP